MKKIGIIGSERIGSAVARTAVAGGLEVVLSNSRGPESLTELVASIGDSVRAATPQETAAWADIVVIAVPIRAVSSLPIAELAGKIVIDATNYDPRLHGDIQELDADPRTTSERLQELLPSSYVVKALNNIFFATLPKLPMVSESPKRTALPIAGDDERARTDVAAFLDTIGYDVVDAGPLSEGWRFQPGTPAQSVYAGATIHDAVPAGTGAVRRALLSATRFRGTTEEERDLITKLYRAIAGEPDLLDEVLASDWEDIPSIPGQPTGPAGIKPHIVDFHRDFENAHVIIHDVVAAGGMVAVRGEMGGVHRGTFLGVEPTGRNDVFTIHEFHEIAAGRIARSWHLEDLHGWIHRVTA